MAVGRADLRSRHFGEKPQVWPRLSRQIGFAICVITLLIHRRIVLTR
jgi:hypothetical protein